MQRLRGVLRGLARSSRGESAVERGFGTDDTLDRLVCDSRSFGPASSAESERTARAPRAARGTSRAKEETSPANANPSWESWTVPGHNVAMTTMSHKPKKNLQNQKKENLPRVSASPGGIANEVGVWVQLSQIQLSSAIQPSR